MKESEFSVVPLEVVQDRRLTLEQTRVLIALFSFRNKTTNTVWPSRASIAERTGMHPSNISAATTALVALGWLRKEGAGGYSKATRYTLCSPSETVAERATVAELATVAERATTPVAESATAPLAERATRTEQSIEQSNEQSISGQAVASPPAKPVKPSGKAKAKADTEIELQAACRATWAAYGQAYQRRYGAAPVRNASVNARIRQFVGRIGYDESPAVAAFFVDSITDAFVLRKLHEVGLLLSGAEGYRTQWVAGHAIAQTSAAPNRQEAQEARNRAAGEQWLRDMQAQQPQESRHA